MHVLETKVNSVACLADDEMEKIYETTFPMVAAWIGKMRGSFEEARDVFHDALVIFMEKRSEGSMPSGVPDESYLFGIVRHLWYGKFRNDRQLVSLDTSKTWEHDVEDVPLSVDDSKLLRLLERTGKKCMDLLQAFYFGMHNLDTIARNLGYRNVHTASVQKYKCLEKIKQTVKQNSAVYEDFFN